MAAAVRYCGPAPAFATVSGSFFAADDAVVMWESVLTGQSVEDLWARGGPRMVAPWVNDGSAVFALSGELLGHLVRADPVALQAIAAAWVAQIIREDDELDHEVALGVAAGVAGLAREAVRTNRLVYCWVAC